MAFTLIAVEKFNQHIYLQKIMHTSYLNFFPHIWRWIWYSQISCVPCVKSPLPVGKLMEYQNYPLELLTGLSRHNFRISLKRAEFTYVPSGCHDALAMRSFHLYPCTSWSEKGGGGCPTASWIGTPSTPPWKEWQTNCGNYSPHIFCCKMTLPIQNYLHVEF